MGNIFSMAAPLLDTDVKITMFITCNLLFIGVVLAIGISLCTYIDHRRRIRLSRAVLDEERWKDEKDLPEVEHEKAPLLQPQSHQHQNRHLISDLQSRTYINGKPSLPCSKYSTNSCLRVWDQGSKLEHAINEPAIFPRRPTTRTTAHVPKYFTKYGMWCNEIEWQSKRGRRDKGQGGIMFPSRTRKDEELDIVIEHL